MNIVKVCYDYYNYNVVYIIKREGYDIIEKCDIFEKENSLLSY